MKRFNICWWVSISLLIYCCFVNNTYSQGLSTPKEIDLGSCPARVSGMDTSLIPPIYSKLIPVINIGKDTLFITSAFSERIPLQNYTLFTSYGNVFYIDGSFSSSSNELMILPDDTLYFCVKYQSIYSDSIISQLTLSVGLTITYHSLLSSIFYTDTVVCKATSVISREILSPDFKICQFAGCATSKNKLRKRIDRINLFNLTTRNVILDSLTVQESNGNLHLLGVLKTQYFTPDDTTTIKLPFLLKPLSSILIGALFEFKTFSNSKLSFSYHCHYADSDSSVVIQSSFESHTPTLPHGYLISYSSSLDGVVGKTEISNPSFTLSFFTCSDQPLYLDSVSLVGSWQKNELIILPQNNSWNMPLLLSPEKYYYADLSFTPMELGYKEGYIVPHFRTMENNTFIRPVFFFNVCR